MNRNRPLIELYLDCGMSGHFLVLSAILFLWLAFICVLPRADGSRSIHSRLLLPCAFLPLLIGLCGSSLQLYGALDFVPDPSSCDFISRPWVALLPLIAGSFLSTAFLFSSVVILFLDSRRTLLKPSIGK